MTESEFKLKLLLLGFVDTPLEDSLYALRVTTARYRVYRLRESGMLWVKAGTPKQNTGQELLMTANNTYGRQEVINFLSKLDDL